MCALNVIATLWPLALDLDVISDGLHIPADFSSHRLERSDPTLQELIEDTYRYRMALGCLLVIPALYRRTCKRLPNYPIRLSQGHLSN